MIQKDSPEKSLSKEEQINKGVVDSLREFLALFCQDRGVRDKGSGRRTAKDQNMYDALMATINGNSFYGGEWVGRWHVTWKSVIGRQSKVERGMQA